MHFAWLRLVEQYHWHKELHTAPSPSICPVFQAGFAACPEFCPVGVLLPAVPPLWSFKPALSWRKVVGCDVLLESTTSSHRWNDPLFLFLCKSVWHIQFWVTGQGIQWKVGRLSALTFLDPSKRPQRFNFLALVIFPDVLETTAPWLPDIQWRRSAEMVII